ncbi:MAG: hypothetical protein WC375_07505, partial [Methanomassiliicoccales archaeon]
MSDINPGFDLDQYLPVEDNPQPDTGYTKEDEEKARRAAIEFTKPKPAEKIEPEAKNPKQGEMENVIKNLGKTVKDMKNVLDKVVAENAELKKGTSESIKAVNTIADSAVLEKIKKETEELLNDEIFNDELLS